MLPIAVTRSSVVVAIRYMLLVLWIMFFSIMGRVEKKLAV